MKKVITSLKRLGTDIKDDPAYYLRSCFLSLFGLAVIAFSVFCAVRAVTIGIATAQASNAASAD